MPQGDLPPRKLTDETTFEERHPEAPKLSELSAEEWHEADEAAVDATPRPTASRERDLIDINHWLKSDETEVNATVKGPATLEVVEGDVPSTDPDAPAPSSQSITEYPTPQESDILAKAELEKAFAAAAEERQGRREAEERARTAGREIVQLQDRIRARDQKLQAVTTGDGLPRSPLLDNPDLDTTDPSAFRGSIIAIATLILSLLAAYGFGIRDDAREPLLALLGTAAAIYATYSIRKRAYSPVTTAKLVDTAYKAGLQGEDRPKVA